MDPIEVVLKLSLDQFQQDLKTSDDMLLAHIRRANETTGSKGSGDVDSHLPPQVSKRTLSAFRERLEQMRRDWQKTMEAIKPQVSLMGDLKKGPMRVFLPEKGGALATSVPSGLLSGTNSDADREKRIRHEADLAKISDAKEKFATSQMKDRAKFARDMTFLMMPLMNPGSVWATLFSTRQTFSAFTQTEKGRGMVGGTLGGAALATGGLVGAMTGLGWAFAGLKKAVEGTMAAYETARHEYAKALTSGGLPLSFTVRRGSLANVMGVSEKDVFQFGKQIGYLNDKLAWSNSIIAKTTPTLTGVAWEFKVAEQNMKGLWATMAHDLAPSLQGATSAWSEFIKSLKEGYEWLKQKSNSVGKQNVFGPSDYYGPASWYKGSGIGPDGKGKLGSMPNPMSYMKQLGASSWERMGLVIGGGGGMNYQAQTAKNTAETVKELKGLRQSAIPRSGAFVYSPAVSNP